MVTNVSITPIFPSISSVLIVLIVGTFNAASSVFLLFKLLSDQFTLKEMFIVLVIGSVVVHVRTFCFMPYLFLKKDDENYSIFRESFVGQLVRKPTSSENASLKLGESSNSSSETVEVDKVKTLKDCLKTPLFWQFLVFFNILSVRVKTMQGEFCIC